MARPKRGNMPDKLTGGPLPLYYQVANLIQNGILTGTWASGNQLPTEEDLVGEYGVSRQTIRKAKGILTEGGFISSIKGSGCYVNGQEAWNTHLPTVDNLADIFHIGSEMAFKIHEFGMVFNTRYVSDKLKNPQDRFVFQIRGIRYHQDRPLSHVVYHLPFQFGSRIPLESLDENPFIPQFEKLAGIQVIEGIQTISLGKAEPNVAQCLDLKKGAPVLVVESVYFDADQQPIEYVRTHYPDKLPYSIRVKRH